MCADELCGLTIERGRSRTISGIAEDYFAELLYKEIGKGYEKTSDELSRAQLALDTVNQRDSFEFCE